MIKTRSLNKNNIEIKENEYRIKKNILESTIKRHIDNIIYARCKKIKVKNVINIIKITDLYSSTLFNDIYKDNLFTFSTSVRKKYLFFIETEPDEKELVYACKKFLDKHYDDINFNLNCEAYTLNGLRCKKYKKEKQFCYIHDGKFVKSIAAILTLTLIPVIAEICIAKLF
jgi:hypothetical protein